jgi:hypothetical protein
MRVPSLCPALALFAASSALAAPATNEGAQELANSYAAYFTHAVIDSGVVAVAPDGDGYLVTWDLSKAMALIDADAGTLAMKPVSYRLTPGEGGVWRLAAQSFPSIALDAATPEGRLSGTFDLHGFQLDGVYDPAEPDFLRSRLGIDPIVGKLAARNEAQTTDIDLAEAGLTAELRAKGAASGAGVDVALVQTIKNLAETMVVKPIAGDNPPAKVDYSIGGAEGAMSLSGLRAKEIADLWKYVAAHADDPPTPIALKAQFDAALPLWDDLKLSADIHDFGVETPVGLATVKTVAEKFSLSGLTRLATAEFGLAFDDLAFQSAHAPEWSALLTPVSLSLDLQFAGRGVDQAVQFALADPAFGEGGELASETQEKIDAALLAGDPKLTLAPGRLTMPALDLAFEGEAAMTGGAPGGHFIVSADGLDKTLDLLQEIAKSEPDAQTAILGVTFLKGLAKTGPDGRLVWKIDIDPTGVLVNGEPLPTGK